jgi:predicted RNA-binding Zn-ribbon protein involved in translation (DUF1610 family)
MKLLNFQMPPDGFKRLFYDIETSPNIGFFWSSSYKANIPHDNIIKERAVICICWKWEGQNDVHSVEWDEGCDKAALKRFMEVALIADELVAHNGDNFDEKWIRTRCLIHGIEMPPKLNSYDTLKKARTHFRFNSNRLDYLGNLLFGEGKNPMGFGDWKAICLDNCSEAMDKMVTYCKQDVRLLEDVFHKLQPYVNHNTHVGAATGGGRFSCPNCGSENVTHQRKRYTMTGVLRHTLKCHEQYCGKHFTISNKVWEDKLKDDWAKKQTA